MWLVLAIIFLKWWPTTIALIIWSIYMGSIVLAFIVGAIVSEQNSKLEDILLTYALIGLVGVGIG